VAKITTPLVASSYSIAETGGTIEFSLGAGKASAYRNYLIVGGVTGTEPGYPLPGGWATLSINFDNFTEYVVLPLLNTGFFVDFLGTLDENGEATAQLNMPPVPGLAGFTMYYAYCLMDPFDYTSNAVAIEIVQ